METLRDCDVLVNPCDCFHSMRWGDCAVVAAEFFGVRKADLLTKYGDRKKLGRLSLAQISSSGGAPVLVVNAYVHWKYDPSRGLCEINFEALDTVLNRLISLLVQVRESIGGRVVRVRFSERFSKDPLSKERLERFSKDFGDWVEVLSSQ